MITGDININGYFSYEIIKRLTFRSVYITNTSAHYQSVQQARLLHWPARMPNAGDWCEPGENFTVTGINATVTSTQINKKFCDINDADRTESTRKHIKHLHLL